jgi:Caspase domain
MTRRNRSSFKTQTMLGVAVALVSSTGFAQPASTSSPRLHGLLIAASDYQNTTITDLPSTANDVALMAQVLRERGAAATDLVVLADAQASAAPRQRPLAIKGKATRALIDVEMANLIRRVKRGDHVVLYFSGHGEQQPNEDRVEEPDGMDEVFLPVDASREQSGALTNGYRDNDIGNAVRTLRQAGATVYLVADFCHSDGASRAGGPARASSTSARRADVRMSNREMGQTDGPQSTGMGGFAAFYAAPSLSQAWGREVPYWMPENRVVYGVLTYYLATALRDPSLSNIGELTARLDRDVLNQSWLLDAGLTPSPQFEGDTSLPLPGGAGGDAALQTALWTVMKPATAEDSAGRTGMDSLNLPAGSLHGVAEGAIIALSVPVRGGVGASRERPVLYGKAQDVTATTARLVPHSVGRITADAWRNLVFEGAPWTMEARFSARVVSPGRQEAIGIALPKGTPGGGRLQRQLVRALELVRSSGADVRFLPADDTTAAYALGWEASALVLWDRTGSTLEAPIRREVARLTPPDVPPVPGDALDAPSPEMRAALLEGLSAATRFHRLRAAALQVADVRPAITGWQGRDGVMEGLTVRTWRLRAPTRTGASAPCATSPSDWKAGQGVPTTAVEITADIAAGSAAPGTVQKCDMVFVTVSSRFSEPVAATLQAQAALPDSGIVPELADWRQRCTRVRGATASDFEDLLCQQYADVGLVMFGSDTAIRALQGSEQGGSATRLAVNGTVTFGFRFERAAASGAALREDLLLLVARPDPRSPGTRASFSHLCQLGAGEHFAGTLGRRACVGGAQGPRRESRAADAPVFDPLADLIWSNSSTTRSANTPARPANTVARRFSFEVGR